MSKDTLESMFESITKVAQDNNIFHVEALPQSEQDGYRVGLPLESFIALLKSCKPRILYAFSATFDARDELVDELLDESADDEDDEDEMADFEGTDTEKKLLADPRVAPLLREFSRYNGKMSSFIASFLVDGVLHTVFEKTDWAEQFESQTNALKALMRTEYRQGENAEYEAQRAQMREHAKRLCAHPKFAEGRPSKEKREYLAQSIFPDVDHRMLSLIVDEATNMLWLNSK